MSWGSADLVPTSRPLRSESALGSVVPFALSSSQTQGHSITRGSLNQERGDAESGASKRPDSVVAGLAEILINVDAARGELFVRK